MNKFLSSAAIAAFLLLTNGVVQAQSAQRQTDKAKEARVDNLRKLGPKGTALLPQLSVTVPAYALPKGASDADRVRLLSNVAIAGERKWYIGRLDLPDETKLDWSGAYCRAHWTEFNGVIVHPSVDGIRQDINDCLAVATAAAVTAGLYTGNVAAASAAFKAALIACLQAKGISWADQIDVWIKPEEGRGDWHYCL